MNPVDEITKQIMLDDIKDLPMRLTPDDIYQYYNKNNDGKAVIGRDRAYEIAREIGYRFREAGKGVRIFVNKTNFIKFVYGE